MTCGTCRLLHDQQNQPCRQQVLPKNPDCAIRAVANGTLLWLKGEG